MRHRLNPHERVNDYQRSFMLIVLPSGLCPAPFAIHLRSKLQATIAFLPLGAKKDILKFLVYQMMTNILVESCLDQEIIKISNLIQVKENSPCPKPKLIRRPNLSESRICPNTECSEVWTEHTT